MPNTPRRSRLGARKVLHVALVLLGWVGFVWMWLLVAQRPWESERLVWLIVGSIVLLPLLTFVWVRHNRDIHRRKGERRAPMLADVRYEHDWHGRSVHADWPVLRRTQSVTITVAGGRKLYRAARPPATPPARPPVRERRIAPTPSNFGH